MKKTLTLVLSLLLIFSLCFMFTSCGSSSSSSSSDSSTTADSSSDDETTEESVVLHFGATQSTTMAWYRAAETLAETVYEESNGTIEISLEFGGVWGSDKEHLEAIENGTLDISINSTVGTDAYVTSIGWVNLPYLINTYEAVEELIYNGWVGESITADVEAAGLKVMGLTATDFRWIQTTGGSVESAADMSGLKLRTPESTMFVSFFQELGANPTAMAIGEVASAMQQGTIDGQDNGPIISCSMGFEQIGKYWTKSNHSFAAAVVTMNNDKFESLSANQQAILSAALTQYCEDCSELLKSDVESNEEMMISEADCNIIEVTDTLDADMQAAALVVWASDDACGNFNTEAMERIRENGSAW